MSWFNLNDSLNNIKGQITSFASDVLTDETELKEAQTKIKQLEEICAAQQVEIENLRGREAVSDVKNEAVWSWTTASTQEDQLKKRISELEEAKKDLESSLVQLDSDCQQSIDKLVTLKDNLQRDYNDLEEERDTLKDEREELLRKLQNLKKENGALKKQNSAEGDDLLKKQNGELREQLEAAVSLTSVLENENQSLKQQLQENAHLKDEIAEINAERVDCGSFERKIADLVNEKYVLHEKYINILTASIKKYIDTNESADLQEIDEDSNLKEFRMQVESVFRVILAFKLKTESLEKELFEKAKMVSEKNYEIEKLLKNSEILSQEVITKTQTIKDYEIECSELMKNNDILINELENYKNSSGLQTISESNEDNMVLLETQLENANKKISELESELVLLQNQYKTLDEQHRTCNNEKDELKTNIENNEYKCTELKIMQDSVKEDLEKYENICAHLTSSNKLLEVSNKEYETKLDALQKQTEELHRKLSSEEELCVQLQAEKNNLTEKLQSFKMAETSLKLHFNKELQTAVEAKQEIESKLSVVLNELAQCKEQLLQVQERNLFLEETRKQFDELKLGNEQLLNKNIELLEQLKISEDNYNTLRDRFESVNIDESRKEVENLQKALEDVSLSKDLNKLSVTETQSWSSGDSSQNDAISDLRDENAKLQSQLNELIGLVNSKQQENITYHAEIQRLNQILVVEVEKSRQLQDSFSEKLQQKQEECEKLSDQNNFLQGKCDVLTQNLLQQQGLEKELERLRVHLVEIEEAYTQELLQAERKNQEIQEKMNEIEEREKNSSTMYTSVSIRANQQVEALQNQIQLLTSQRDELRQRISDAEDENNRQLAALTNLNFVLQQFQREKENDVKQETDRIRRQIKAEKDVQQELQQEINSLKSQLEETRQGLQAASRLGDQLEYTKKQNVALKEEGTAWRTHVHEKGPRLSKLQEQFKRSEARYKEITNQADGRVDKNLIKNLIIGFVSSNNNLTKDQYQILKIIATVLDFNQQEHDKVNLNKAHHNSWLSSLLNPQNSVDGQQTGQSLSEAFVKFLENESKPKVIPNLLDSSKKETTSSSSNGSTPRQSPIVLNEMVLPTFSDFGQNRNSSSILKDVLKDNS